MEQCTKYTRMQRRGVDDATFRIHANMSMTYYLHIACHASTQLNVSEPKHVDACAHIAYSMGFGYVSPLTCRTAHSQQLNRN